MDNIVPLLNFYKDITDEDIEYACYLREITDTKEIKQIKSDLMALKQKPKIINELKNQNNINEILNEIENQIKKNVVLSKIKPILFQKMLREELEELKKLKKGGSKKVKTQRMYLKRKVKTRRRHLKRKLYGGEFPNMIRTVSMILLIYLLSYDISLLSNSNTDVYRSEQISKILNNSVLPIIILTILSFRGPDLNFNTNTNTNSHLSRYKQAVLNTINNYPEINLTELFVRNIECPVCLGTIYENNTDNNYNSDSIVKLFFCGHWIHKKCCVKWLEDPELNTNCLSCHTKYFDLRVYKSPLTLAYTENEQEYSTIID